jgi:hypothetical protein
MSFGYDRRRNWRRWHESVESSIEYAFEREMKLHFASLQKQKSSPQTASTEQRVDMDVKKEKTVGGGSSGSGSEGGNGWTIQQWNEVQSMVTSMIEPVLVEVIHRTLSPNVIQTTEWYPLTGRIRREYGKGIYGYGWMTRSGWSKESPTDFVTTADFMAMIIGCTSKEVCRSAKATGSPMYNNIAFETIDSVHLLRYNGMRLIYHSRGTALWLPPLPARTATTTTTTPSSSSSSSSSSPVSTTIKSSMFIDIGTFLWYMDHTPNSTHITNQMNEIGTVGTNYRDSINVKNGSPLLFRDIEPDMQVRPQDLNGMYHAHGHIKDQFDHSSTSMMHHNEYETSFVMWESQVGQLLFYHHSDLTNGSGSGSLSDYNMDDDILHRGNATVGAIPYRRLHVSRLDHKDDLVVMNDRQRTRYDDVNDPSSRSYHNNDPLRLEIHKIHCLGVPCFALLVRYYDGIARLHDWNGNIVYSFMESESSSDMKPTILPGKVFK